MSDKRSYIYVFLLGMAMLVATYAHYQLSPISGQVIEQYGLTLSEFSSLFTAPMIPSVFLAIPAGAMIDRFGPRPLIFSAVAFTALGVIGRVFVMSYAMFFLAMVLSGVAPAIINASSSKVTGQWFPLESVSQMVGLVLAFGSLGMVLAMSTTALLPNIDAVFWLSALLCIVVSIAVWSFLKFPKQEQNTDQKQEPISMGQALRRVLQSPNIWIAGLSAGLVMGLNMTLSIYLPMSLQSRGLALHSAGILSSVFLVGVLVGTAVGPTLMARFVGLKRYILFVSVLGALLAIGLWKLQSFLPIALALFFIGFAIGSLKPIFLSLPVYFSEIGPRYAATGGGVIATLQLLGAVVLPTYVYLPIAGESFLRLYLVAGLGFLLIAPLSRFLRTRASLPPSS